MKKSVFFLLPVTALLTACLAAAPVANQEKSKAALAVQPDKHYAHVFIRQYPTMDGFMSGGTIMYFENQNLGRLNNGGYFHLKIAAPGKYNFKQENQYTTAFDYRVKPGDIILIQCEANIKNISELEQWGVTDDMLLNKDARRTRIIHPCWYESDPVTIRNILNDSTLLDASLEEYTPPGFQEYAQAVQENSVSAYQAYLARYPNSAYAPEAKRNLTELTNALAEKARQERDNAWQTLVNQQQCTLNIPDWAYLGNACLNGKAHGQGKAVSQDGADTFVGQFAYGNLSQGALYHANALTYEGQFSNGIKHGKGVCVLANGQREECEYNWGKRSDEAYLVRQELAVLQLKHKYCEEASTNINRSFENLYSLAKNDSCTDKLDELAEEIQGNQMFKGVNITYADNLNNIKECLSDSNDDARSYAKNITDNKNYLRTQACPQSEMYKSADSEAEDIVSEIKKRNQSIRSAASSAVTRERDRYSNWKNSQETLSQHIFKKLQSMQLQNNARQQRYNASLASNLNTLTSLHNNSSGSSYSGQGSSFGNGAVAAKYNQLQGRLKKLQSKCQATGGRWDSNNSACYRAANASAPGVLSSNATGSSSSLTLSTQTLKPPIGNPGTKFDHAREYCAGKTAAKNFNGHYDFKGSVNWKREVNDSGWISGSSASCGCSDREGFASGVFRAASIHHVNKYTKPGLVACPEGMHEVGYAYSQCDLPSQNSPYFSSTVTVYCGKNRAAPNTNKVTQQ